MKLLFGHQLSLSHDPSLLWQEAFLILPKHYLPSLHLEGAQTALMAELLTSTGLAAGFIEDTRYKTRGVLSQSKPKGTFLYPEPPYSFHFVEIRALTRFREDHTVCHAYTLPSLSCFSPPPPLWPWVSTQTLTLLLEYKVHRDRGLHLVPCRSQGLERHPEHS